MEHNRCGYKTCPLSKTEAAVCVPTCALGQPKTDTKEIKGATMSGNKHDQDKIRTDLLPVRPLLAIAKVLTHGAKKYGDNNWRKGLKWSRPYGAILRHLFAWWLGEDTDKDSGEPHLACAATELLFLLEFATTHKELDDRVKEEKS